MDWTEEDVKVKVILPFFQQLGFDASEISCEVHAEFRFGTNVYSADKPVQKARGRIDYLVSLPEMPNLILVEAKRDDAPLQQEDFDQGLSYAKGVDPFPSVTMVTNGAQWRVFNTRTGEEITGQDIDGYTLDLGEAERFYKAIRRLRTLSNANLERFCRWHVAEHIRPLLGSKTEDSKRYIPELFHEPAGLAGAFEGFLGGDSQAFVVTGRSGDGKSCWMCHRAQSLLNSGWHVFFFRGQEIRRGIAQQLATEVSAQLGPHYTPQELIRRIRELTSKALVFVDGLDEIPSDLAIEITSDFLRCAAAPGLRLVATCKSTCWSSLVELDGVPTALSDQVRIHHSHYAMPVLWQPSDFYPLLDKYREFYDCEARIGTKALLEASRSPYVLRLLMEGGRGKDNSSLISLDHKELYDEMLLQLRRRVGAAVPNFESILILIAEAILEKDTDVLEETEILRALGLKVTDELPAPFFHSNLLERHYPEDSVAKISFYFGRLKDFLIGFRVLKWHLKSPEELKTAVAGAENSKLLRDALELFYSLASEDQKRVLDGPLYDYGMTYLKSYEEFATTNFPCLKTRLVHDWEGDAKLGFIGEIMLSPLFLRMEGVRAGLKDIPSVILNPSNSDRKFTVLADTAYFGRYTGKHERVEQSACHAIWYRVAGLLKARNLDESPCLDLLRERIIAFQARPYNSVAEGQPTSVRESRWGILFKKARRHREHVIHAKKEKEGRCRVKWDGQYKGVIFTTSAAEQKEINEFATEMADSGTIVHTDVNELAEREEDRVLGYLDVLEKAGVTVLDDGPLGSWYFKGFSERTPAARRELIAWLAAHLMPTYLDLVKHNFPTYWHMLPLIAEPVKLLILLDDEDDGMEYWKYRAVKETKVELIDQAPSHPESWKEWPPDLIGQGNSRHALPRSYRAARLGEDLNNNFLIFHTLVYDQISHDLAATIPEFAEAARLGPGSQEWI